MIEKKIKNYLEKALKVPVWVEHREDEPDSFIIFEKTGGYVKNTINHSTFAFQSYGKTLTEALKLNNKLLDYMMIFEDANVKLNSNYNFTDTSTKKYRYQAILELIY